MLLLGLRKRGDIDMIDIDIDMTMSYFIVAIDIILHFISWISKHSDKLCIEQIDSKLFIIQIDHTLQQTNHRLYSRRHQLILLHL